MAPGDVLVCLGDGSPPRWDGSTAAASVPAAAPPPIPPAPQRLMVIGWNRIAPGLLSKLDPLVAPGSTVTVLCDSDLVDAAEIVVPPLEHLTVEVTTVPEPELEVVSALADGTCSAIAVLAHQGVAPKDADAITLATLMAVRRAATTNGREPGPFVVAELTDSKHDELAVFAGAHETVARSALLGDAIAFAAVSPRARPIVAALQTPHGPTVRLIPAIDLGLVGEHTVAAIAAARPRARGAGDRHAPSRAAAQYARVPDPSCSCTFDGPRPSGSTRTMRWP